MGQIDYTITVNNNNKVFEEYLKSYINDIQNELFPYGISLPSYNTINYHSFRKFINIYQKCKYWLIYVDNGYYIQKMIFYCDYINRNCPYINFNLSFEVQQILDEIKLLEETYFYKKV